MGMTATIEYLDTPVGSLRVTMRNASAEIEVPSSTPGKSYVVTITRSFISCTCRAAQYGKPCKHVHLVKTAIGA